MIDAIDYDIKKGLSWEIINGNNARQTCEKYGYNYDILKMEGN